MAEDLQEGISIAKNTIDSGKAFKKLEELVEISGGNKDILKNLV